MSEQTAKRISYWDENTELYSEYQRLYDELVPASGDADSTEGQLIRFVSKLFYEYCNNGNCNARDFDDSSSMWDDDDPDFDPEEGEATVSEFYKDILGFIRWGCPGSRSMVREVENLICRDGRYRFSQEEMDVYNRLTDHVVKYVLEQEKKRKA